MISQRNEWDNNEHLLHPPAAPSIDLLLHMKVEFVPSEEFERPGAKKRIMDDPPPLPIPDSGWYGPLMRPLGESLAGTKPLRERSSVVLSKAQEQVAFLQYNYARFRLHKAQTAVRTSRPGRRQEAQLHHWYRTQHQLRHLIAECNLALVLAMSKRINMGDMDYGELISEGNMALMRSIDKFDIGRGFKFSTYGCRAILKSFSRHGGKHLRYRQRFSIGLDPTLERSNYPQERRLQELQDSADEVRHLVLRNAANLSEVEQEVIHHRFRIGPGDAAGITHARPRTLAQVGKLIGLTKERVRQIQNKALRKLRMAIEESSLPLEQQEDFRQHWIKLLN